MKYIVVKRSIATYEVMEQFRDQFGHEYYFPLATAVDQRSAERIARAMNDA